MEDMMEKSKRPFGVWVITLLYAYAYGVGVLSSLLVVIQFDAAIPGDQHFFSQVKTFDWIVLAISASINLTATGLLLFLKKSAFPLFCLGAAITPLTYLWDAMGRGVRPSNLAAGLIGWVISVFICKYVWDLKKAGRLN